MKKKRSYGKKQRENLKPSHTELKRIFEAAYQNYHRRELLHTDPIGVVHQFSDPREQEVVALLAALHAYGRSELIIQFVQKLLARLPKPLHKELPKRTDKELQEISSPLYYRFYTSQDVFYLLTALKHILKRFHSLHDAFLCGAKSNSVFQSLQNFRSLFIPFFPEKTHLLPCAQSGTAKRWHLYLRWMIRKDAVDLGLWDCLQTSALFIPLDIHIHRTARTYGLTRLKSPSQHAMIEITEAFRQLDPQDPLRYDFALTRMGTLKLSA